jgi:hypothetical protein
VEVSFNLSKDELKMKSRRVMSTTKLSLIINKTLHQKTAKLCPECREFITATFHACLAN